MLSMLVASHVELLNESYYQFTILCTGKTLLANAIAGEISVPFFRVAATELVSGISGDSEARIRKLFAEAIEVVCFWSFDEVRRP